MAVCDISPQEALTDAKCFACLTPYQLQQVMAVLLCKILQQQDPMATCDFQTLLDDVKCFDCLTAYQLQLVSVALLCEIKSSIAEGIQAATCVSCGAVNPVGAPSAGCTCALYYNTATGGLWYWNAGTAAWVQLIGG